MSGRSWKNMDSEKAIEIRKYLLDRGGVEKEVKSPHEIWRIKFSDATFTYYKKGTLYSTPSNSKDPAVFDAWRYIDSLVGSRYVLPTKNFLIGLDETGKGEVIGHTILTGVILPSKIFKEIDLVVGPADTKKRHKFEYWDELFRELDSFRKHGLDFVMERIPPWHVDMYNLNKIMDVTYQRILLIFFRKADVAKCRIVMDDYGIGPTLQRFLNFLEKQGAEIIVTSNADMNYLEAKVASLISKRAREEVIKRINENPDFQINGLSVGSGNAGDSQTIEWLKKWHESGKEWPWFVKRSFRNVRELEGKSGKVKKSTPPIKEELLSKEFLEEFNKGHLSIQSLSLICPNCGETNKVVTFAIYKEKSGKRVSGIKCPSCKNLIDFAGLTLRYYCGYVVPDSNIIQRRLLSRDLKSSRFFENFTIILPAVVRKECDPTPTGRDELGELARFASMGRIKLEYEGKIEEVQNGLPSTVRDEMITNVALENNAIVLTADKSMRACCIAKGVFTISI